MLRLLSEPKQGEFMSLEVMIYLAGVVGRLDSSIQGLQALFIISVLIIVFSAMIRASSDFSDKEDRTFLAYLKIHLAFVPKWAVICFLLSCFLEVFIPKEKTIYIIAATSLSKEIVQSKGVQTLYDKSFKLLESKLDEQLSDLTEKKK